MTATLFRHVNIN